MYANLGSLDPAIVIQKSKNRMKTVFSESKFIDSLELKKRLHMECLSLKEQESDKDFVDTNFWGARSSNLKAQNR